MPRYVAGTDRGVLPTGVWSTSSTRSMPFAPSMARTAPGSAPTSPSSLRTPS